MEGIGERYARDVETGKRYKLPKDTTYKQWKQMQDEKYGVGTVDKQRKIGYNYSEDKKQYNEYKSRLGSDAPKTPMDFCELKYGNPTAYSDLCELYAYKGRVPEATSADYRTYKAIKATGIRGTVRVPPLQAQPANILADKAARDPEHIFARMAERKITKDDIQGYIDNALFSAKQFKGTRRVFYSEKGVAVLVKTKDYPGIDWIVKTVWSSDDFDGVVGKAIEEALKNGK